MPPYVLKPKIENKNTLYIPPCLNVTLCIKTKNRKQKHNTKLHERNREKCENSLQSKSKFFDSFKGNL